MAIMHNQVNANLKIENTSLAQVIHSILQHAIIVYSVKDEPKAIPLFKKNWKTHFCVKMKKM